MQQFKRVAAMLLCLVMLFSCVPMGVFAADSDSKVVDAAVIFSDLHTSSSNYKKDTLQGIMTALKNTGLPFSSVTSAGDAFSVNEDSGKYTGKTSTLTGYIQEVLGNVPVNYVWSDHDRYAVQADGKTLLSNDSGFVYGAGADGQYGTDDDANYYIYSLSMADLSTNNRYNADFHTDAEVTAAISAFTVAAAELKQDRPLFIASHQPLLDRRNDNGHAYEWATAINAVAESMDVAFFFGHNHRYDVEKDYFYGKGETMSVCSDSSGSAKDVTLNFTHMCAGYMAPSSTGSTSNTTRQGVAVAITIYEDAINYTTYSSSGVYTGNYALNETVTRSFAASSTPEETVPETSEPATEAPEIEEDLSNSVTIGGTGYEEKTVYVLVDEPVAGEKYLIANIAETGNNIYGNSGNPEEVPGRVIVRNNTSVTYADVEVKEGTITTADTTYTDAKYIELDNSGAVWTVGSGLSFKNGNYYLNRSSSSLSLGSSASISWTYSKDADRLTTSSSSKTYYLYHTYYSDTWKLTESNGANEDSTRNIFFYKQVTAKIPTSNQVTYSMQASNLDHILTDGANTAKLSYALLANGAAATLPSGGSYKFEVVNDTADIISGVSNDGTVTFTGNEGTCYVKVSYTWGENTVYKYVTVTAKKPFYKLEITAEADGTIISGTQTAKGDVAGTSRDYSAKLLLNGVTESTIDLSKVAWTSSNTAIATVDANGVVTFAGGEGTVQITATYENGDTILTDTINIYVTEDAYIYPADGTNDFPEYPNEGAIRFDKTAEAVGTFSETGVAKLELSMTGVPYTTNNKMDVVLMLDRSSSMTDARINATRAAVKVFIKNIVMNEDGSFNGNRIYVGDFMGGNPEYAEPQHNFKITSYTSDEGYGYQIINDTAEYNALIAKIDSTFKKQSTSYGTEYAQSLEYCYNLLDATKDDGNKQFCVFMSDGIPNVFQYGENSKYESTGDLAEMFTGTNYNTRSSKYHYEYHSTRMKANGVTVFSVGLGLQNTNTAWSGVSATGCLNAASLMLNDISGPAGEAEPDTGTTLSKKDEYFFSVADANAAAGMENVFGSIAQKILEAATDVVVTDKVDDKYTMVFGIPKSQYTDHSQAVENALAGEEFYIEFVEYALDADHERTTSTSKLKLYLGVTGNTYYAATAYGSTNGANKFADPVFTPKTGDAKAYWSVVDNSYAAKAGEIVIKVGSTTYKFIENGSGTHDMTSGAYAYGTIDETTNMSDDLVIVTPYFAYCAETRMLAWTVEKLTTVEYALNYFLYLDNSAADISEDTETNEGPYPTNDWAYITYTNFNGNDCRQEFPIPQLTWNGAQVSYVFYLVNGDGQPINKSGQVVDFANATFITDVFTKHIIWNDPDTPVTGAESEKEGVAHLDANYEANDLLPGDYTLYDNAAYYELVVYEDHEGNVLKNYFKINGSEANGSVSSTTKVYNTKAGDKYSAYGTYTKENVADTFDFGNTTVAFAVVWEPKLVPDTVVVDYGLDVLIDVVRNDLLQNTVHGIGKEKGSTAINSGISTVLKYESAPLTIDGNTITIEDENRIRFHQGDMEFKEPVTFYYDSAVSFYEKSEEKSGYLYSSVTVIPATTIYYEDEYVTLKTFTATDAKDDDGNVVYTEESGWKVNSQKASAVQQQDRPGASQISAALDADNNYGYDAAYRNQSLYSMGSAAMTTVKAGVYATAEFDFYGTGFDIISLTDKTTGTIVVKVYNEAGEEVVATTVNTYYGYARVNYAVTYTYDAETETWEEQSKQQVGELGTSQKRPENPTDGAGYTVYETRWETTTSNDPNALYQVPVLKVGDSVANALPYGKYKAVITATYISFLDKTAAEGYDFYLDAIRVYNPTGNQNGTANNAYKEDGEGWPTYKELRNIVISAATFNSLKDGESVSGIVFIDGANANGADNVASVQDYISYGPNNELYLESGNAVAFDLNATAAAGEIAKIQLAVKTVGGTGSIEVYSVTSEGKDKVCLDQEISTATDMYYDITALNNKTVVIRNSGDASDAILSITNVKITYTEAQPAAQNNDNGVSAASVEEISEPVAMFSIRRSTAANALMSMPVTEEVEEETTEATEPETTEPETEVTEPETEATEPETEETVPETTEPGTGNSSGKTIIKIIKKLIGWLFG